MRILHILAPGEAGGLERVVQALALGHRARGLEVHLAVILDQPDPGHPFFAPLGGTGVGLHPLPLPARAYRQERAAVRALIRDLRPHVVHTHGYRPDVVDGGVPRRVGLPTVTTVHGFTGGGWRNRVYEHLQVRAFRTFDAVVAVSEPLVARLARGGVPRDRIRLLRNGWREMERPLPRADARARLGVADDRFHVGWVGRLSREKAPDLLLDALARLRDLPIVATVIGDGREAAPLRARAAELGLADRVRWAGVVQNADRLFPAFDLFVLSSRTEGTPVVLFEAMAAGVPIVATAVGGVPDVVSSTEGVLVPADDPDALAAAIRGVCERRSEAAARAAAARRRLEERFGAEAWLAGYERIYGEVSARSGARSTTH